jgi:hypothetical protein
VYTLGRDVEVGPGDIYGLVPRDAPRLQPRLVLPPHAAVVGEHAREAVHYQAPSGTRDIPGTKLSVNPQAEIPKEDGASASDFLVSKSPRGKWNRQVAEYGRGGLAGSRQRLHRCYILPPAIYGIEG